MLARSGRVFLPWVVLAAVLGSVVLVAHTFAGSSKIVPHTLTVLFSGDDMGNIKGCG